MAENKLTSEQVYRNSPIRNISVIFGSIFSNITVRTYKANGDIDDRTRKVPLAYSAKNQYALWLNEKMRLPNGNIEAARTFPRMSYELTTMAMAPERGTNTNVHLYNRNIDVNGVTKRIKSPVSYNFSFTLSIWSKNMDEAVQILEYILPVFTPEISVKVRESKAMSLVNDVRIVLTSISKEDNYQQGFEENRIIAWNLEFEVHADILPRENEVKIIQTVIIDTVQDITDRYLDGEDPDFILLNTNGETHIEL